MNFEKAYATSSLPTAEEFHTALQPIVDPNVSEELLMRYAQAKAPGVDVIERDPTQRQHRAEISRKMREAMVGFLEANNQTLISRNKTERVQLPRELAYDTLLLLPHPELNEEYERRYDILVNGTPEQKKKLLFDALREAKQGYTPEKLYSLSDEEIAADFENLHRLKQFASSAAKISNIEFLKLSPDEKKELLDFEKEFQSPSGAIFARAKLVSSPYYELLHPERFPESGGAEIEEITEDENELDALAEVETCVSTYQGIGLRTPWVQIVQTQGLEGYQPQEVTWLDQDGAEIHRRDPRGKILPMVEPPVGELILGKPLFAMLPNGETKVFFPSQPEGSRIILKNEPLSVYMMDKRNPALLGKLSGSMDKQIPGALDSLSKSLKKVDHWYVRSSQAFKNVWADLEKMQEEWRALGPNPSEYQRDRLRERMQELDAHCAEYIDNKNQKEKLNDRDKERLAAIKAVSQFAKMQIANLRILDSRAEVRAEIQRSKKNAEERAAFEEARSPEARELRNAFANIWKEKDFYRDMKLPASDAGNKINEFRERIAKEMNTFAITRSLAMDPRLKEKKQEENCEFLIVGLVIMDLCQKERTLNGFHKEGDQAGPIETFLNQNHPDEKGNLVSGETLLINSIKQTPKYQEIRKNLDLTSMGKFITERQARKDSTTMLSQLDPAVKEGIKNAVVKQNQKQNTVDKSRQNKPVNPIMK